MNRARAFLGLMGKSTWVTLLWCTGALGAYTSLAGLELPGLPPPDRVVLAALLFPAWAVWPVAWAMWSLYWSTFAVALPALRSRLLSGFLVAGALVSGAVVLIFWRPESGHNPVVLYSVAMAMWCIGAGGLTMPGGGGVAIVLAGGASIVLSGPVGSFVRMHPVVAAALAVCAAVASSAGICGPAALRMRLLSTHAGKSHPIDGAVPARSDAVAERTDFSTYSTTGYRASFFSYVVAASLEKGRSWFPMTQMVLEQARGVHPTADDVAFAGVELVLRSVVLTVVFVVFVGISGTAIFWTNTEQLGSIGSFAGAAIRAVFSIEAGRGMSMTWTWWTMLTPFLMSPMFAPIPRLLRSAYPLSRDEKARVAFGLTLVESLGWVVAFIVLLAMGVAVAARANVAVTMSQARTAVCGFIGVLALPPLAEVLRYRRSNDNPARVRPSTLLVTIPAYIAVGLMPVWIRYVSAWPLPPGGDIVFWIALVAAAHLGYRWWLRRYFAKADILKQGGPRELRIV